jgi:hypothetical protein
MGIKPAIQFSLYLIPDGIANSVTVVIATAPFMFVSTGLLSSTFNISTVLPTAITGVSSSDGQVLTATFGLLNTTIKFSWPNPPTGGSSVTVYGTFEF